jgi:hypothetical protein
MLSTLKKVSHFTLLSWHGAKINSNIVLGTLKQFFLFVQGYHYIKYVKSYLLGFDYRS